MSGCVWVCRDISAPIRRNDGAVMFEPDVTGRAAGLGGGGGWLAEADCAAVPTVQASTLCCVLPGCDSIWCQRVTHRGGCQVQRPHAVRASVGMGDSRPTTLSDAGSACGGCQGPQLVARATKATRRAAWKRGGEQRRRSGQANTP